jgi:hypothetical protein
MLVAPQVVGVAGVPLNVTAQDVSWWFQQKFDGRRLAVQKTEGKYSAGTASNPDLHRNPRRRGSEIYSLCSGHSTILRIAHRGHIPRRRRRMATDARSEAPSAALREQHIATRSFAGPSQLRRSNLDWAGPQIRFRRKARRLLRPENDGVVSSQTDVCRSLRRTRCRASKAPRLAGSSTEREGDLVLLAKMGNGTTRSSKNRRPKDRTLNIESNQGLHISLTLLSSTARLFVTTDCSCHGLAIQNSRNSLHWPLATALRLLSCYRL